MLCLSRERLWERAPARETLRPQGRPPTKWPSGALRVSSQRFDHGIAHLHRADRTLARFSDVRRAQSLCQHLLHSALDPIGGRVVEAAAWLDESFATYSDYSFKPSKRLLRESHRAERSFFGYVIEPFEPGPLASSGNPRRLDFRLDNNMAFWEDKEVAYQDTVYASGAELLIRLQRKIGLKRMDQLLRSIVAEHRFGIESGSDFLASLRRARVSRRTISEFIQLSRIRVS